MMLRVRYKAPGGVSTDRAGFFSHVMGKRLYLSEYEGGECTVAESIPLADISTINELVLKATQRDTTTKGGDGHVE